MTEIDDEFPVDEKSAAAVAHVLRSASPSTARLADQHEADHGEILPTLLLDLAGTWWRSAVRGRGSDVEEAQAVVSALADLYLEGDEGIATVVVTGFLEALPHPQDDDRPVVESLPPVLRAELRKMEAWRPE